MSAIEYGSYYWCVMLNGTESQHDGNSVHLHADEMSIDSVGTLTFSSFGRRPAGVEPSPEQKGDGGSQQGNPEQQQSQNQQRRSMIYMAFAPGTWRFVYAAKLQDGSPASVERWNSAGGNSELAKIPADSGARGYAAPNGAPNLSLTNWSVPQEELR